VQGGVHLLSGLILASFSKRKEFKLGSVIGAILPDVDIIFLAVAYLFIGVDSGYIHRSFTHSLLFLVILTTIIISLRFIPYIRKKTDYDFLGLGVGIGIGIIVHIFLDMLYLDGVLFLWPFYNETIGFPIIPFSSFNTVDPTDMIKLKLIQTTDFYTDIFLFYIPMLYLAYKMDVHKKIRLPFLIYSIIDFIVITIFVGLSFKTTTTYENHVINVYYLGTLFLFFSLISPIFFRDIIREFKFEPWILVIILALLIFSQFLFYV